MGLPVDEREGDFRAGQHRLMIRSTSGGACSWPPPSGSQGRPGFHTLQVGVLNSTNYD
jgi:hypothetical protein